MLSVLLVLYRCECCGVYRRNFKKPALLPIFFTRLKESTIFPNFSFPPFLAIFCFPIRGAIQRKDSNRRFRRCFVPAKESITLTLVIAGKSNFPRSGTRKFRLKKGSALAAPVRRIGHLHSRRLPRLRHLHKFFQFCSNGLAVSRWKSERGKAIRAACRNDT